MDEARFDSFTPPEEWFISSIIDQSPKTAWGSEGHRLSEHKATDGRNYRKHAFRKQATRHKVIWPATRSRLNKAC